MARPLSPGVSWAFILLLSKLIRTSRCHTNEIVRATQAGTPTEDPRGWRKGSGAVKDLRKSRPRARARDGARTGRESGIMTSEKCRTLS